MRHSVFTTHEPETVLIVGEDDPARDALVSLLKPDYRMLRAASADAALQMFVREEVDLLLLSISRPRRPAHTGIPLSTLKFKMNRLAKRIRGSERLTNASGYCSGRTAE